MNIAKLIIGLIAVLLVLAGCSKSPVGQALESLDEAKTLAGQVTTLHYDVFSQTPIFFINSQEDARISYGADNKLTFIPSITKGIVQSTGYYLSKTGWKSFTFTGSQKSGNWIAAPVTATVTDDALNFNQKTIVLAYVCQYNDPNKIFAGTGSLTQTPSIAGWKCGCLDASGKDCNHYMAQSFENLGSHVAVVTNTGGFGTGVNSAG